MVKKIRKFAVETAGCQQRERKALERSFERFRFKVGKRSWNWEDLYACP